MGTGGGGGLRERADRRCGTCPASGGGIGGGGGIRGGACCGGARA